MIVGLLRERKPGEGRVALVPADVRDLVASGVEVWVESAAGRLSGFADDAYRESGAKVTAGMAELFARAELIVKVKEILREELPHLAPRHVLFTFVHGRMFQEVTSAALKTGCSCLAYEEVVLADGSRPLLRPMSEIAGKLGFLKAVEYLQSVRGGPGEFAAAVEGLAPLEVLVLGLGTVGTAAAGVALALGNSCRAVEVSASRRAAVKALLPAIEVCDSTEENVRRLLPRADVVLNATTVGSWSKTHVVTREMLRLMKPTALIVDVSCDPAGGVETCRLTTHEDPIYEVDGIRHYCVDNIAGAVPATASRALRHATFPYVRALATKGLAGALRDAPALARALIFRGGKVTHEAVAAAWNVPCSDVFSTLNHE